MTCQPPGSGTSPTSACWGGGGGATALLKLLLPLYLSWMLLITLRHEVPPPWAVLESLALSAPQPTQQPPHNLLVWEVTSRLW